jgi:hypothetical protein
VESASAGLIVRLYPARCDGVNLTSPTPGLRAQRVGAISVGSWRPAQAAELDEGPNANGEADDMQDDESHSDL